MGNALKSLSPGISVAVALIAITSSAEAKCSRPDPIFGMKTYYDDEYCERLEQRARPLIRKAPVHRARMKASTWRESMMQPTAGNASIKEMQTLLAGLGYDPGPVDGRDGPATRQAATAFRGAVGLPANASSKATIAVLKRLSGK